MSDDVMEKLVSLCKRKGFIFQSSEIYGGLNGCWDYGPLGVELLRNIKDAWWTSMTYREDVEGIDASILMHPRTWEASGHVDSFSDPMVEDKKTNERFRLDHLLEDNGIDVAGLGTEEMSALLREHEIKSPKGNELSDPRQFNLMFKTFVGPLEDDSARVYLRPETAQASSSIISTCNRRCARSCLLASPRLARHSATRSTPRTFSFAPENSSRWRCSFSLRRAVRTIG